MNEMQTPWQIGIQIMMMMINVMTFEPCAGKDCI